MSNPVIKSVFPFVNDGQKQLKTDAEEHGSTSQREVTTNPGKLRLEMKSSQKNTVESSDEVNQSLPQNTQQLQQLRITVPTQAQPALEKAIESSQNGKEHSQEASQNNQSSSSVQGASNAQESNKSENASQGLDNSQQGQDTANEKRNK